MKLRLGEEGLTKASDMKVGDLGQIVDGEINSNEILLRIHEGIVSLTEPEHTWMWPNIPVFKIQLLRTGTRVILEQE